MELATGVAITSGLIATKEVLQKVLGPSADYFGGELKNLFHR
jgi:hypothetical protein